MEVLVYLVFNNFNLEFTNFLLSLGDKEFSESARRNRSNDCQILQEKILGITHLYFCFIFRQLLFMKVGQNISWLFWNQTKKMSGKYRGLANQILTPITVNLFVSQSKIPTSFFKIYTVWFNKLEKSVFFKPRDRSLERNPFKNYKHLNSSPKKG